MSNHHIGRRVGGKCRDSGPSQDSVVVGVGHPDAIGTDAFIDRHGAPSRIGRSEPVGKQHVEPKPIDQVGSVVVEIELSQHQVGAGIARLTGTRRRHADDFSMIGGTRRRDHQQERCNSSAGRDEYRPRPPADSVMILPARCFIRSRPCRHVRSLLLRRSEVRTFRSMNENPGADAVRRSQRMTDNQSLGQQSLCQNSDVPLLSNPWDSPRKHRAREVTETKNGRPLSPMESQAIAPFRPGFRSLSHPPALRDPIWVRAARFPEKSFTQLAVLIGRRLRRNSRQSGGPVG